MDQVAAGIAAALERGTIGFDPVENKPALPACARSKDNMRTQARSMIRWHGTAVTPALL